MRYHPPLANLPAPMVDRVVRRLYWKLVLQHLARIAATGAVCVALYVVCWRWARPLLVVPEILAAVVVIMIMLLGLTMLGQERPPPARRTR